MMPDSNSISLFTSNHRQIISWFDKFFYVCFEKRSKLDRGQIWRKVNWLNVAAYWPVQMRLTSVYFELYNHPTISLVNVIYDVYMRICDASQIRVWDKTCTFVVVVILVITTTIIITIFVVMRRHHDLRLCNDWPWLTICNLVLHMQLFRDETMVTSYVYRPWGHGFKVCI